MTRFLLPLAGARLKRGGVRPRVARGPDIPSHARVSDKSRDTLPCLALCRSEAGASLIEVAVMMPVLMFLLIGVVDVSQAYYYSIVVSDAAEAGALYGSLNSSDTSGMVSAATLDAPNLKGGINATASHGCECLDGTGRVAGCLIPPVSCISTYVNYVQVSTSWTYQPVLPYPGLQSSFALQGLATMRASQ